MEALADMPADKAKEARAARRLPQRRTEAVMLGLLPMSDRDSVEQLRRGVRAYYRQLGPVKEWAENNYWHLPLAQQGPELITINAFWRDYRGVGWQGRVRLAATSRRRTATSPR